MERTSSIRLKAFFLLVVFLLNTVITFACSVGLEMSQDESYHELETLGKSHDHEESDHKAKTILKVEPKVLHHHAEGGSKPHDHSEKSEGKKAPNDQNAHPQAKVEDDHHKAGSEDDNCCKDEAIKFGKADKIVQKSAKFIMAPVYLPLFIIANSIESAKNLPTSLVNRKHLVRGHHPPIASIRIAIRSFQI